MFSLLKCLQTGLWGARVKAYSYFPAYLRPLPNTRLSLESISCEANIFWIQMSCWNLARNLVEVLPPEGPFCLFQWPLVATLVLFVRLLIERGSRARWFRRIIDFMFHQLFRTVPSRSNDRPRLIRANAALLSDTGLVFCLFEIFRQRCKAKNCALVY